MPSPQLTKFAVLPALPQDYANGLIGWWPFLNGVITDQSGFQNVTAVGGAYSLDNSPAGPAVAFNGVTAPVTMTPCAALNAAVAITYSGWFKFSAFTNSYSGVIGRDPAVNTNYCILLVKSNGKLAWYSWGVSGATDYDGTGVNTLATNTWYHLCATYDPVAGGVAYVNGAVDGTCAANGNLSVISGTNLNIGYDAGVSGRNINGSFSDARVYNRALSAAEVVTLYRQGIAFPIGVGESDLPPAGLPSSMFAGVGGLTAILSPIQPQSLLVTLAGAGFMNAAGQPMTLYTGAAFAGAGNLITYLPWMNLSTQYVEAITSGNPAVGLSTQYAEVLHTGDNPQVGLSTEYIEIIAGPQGTPFVLQQEGFRFRTDTGPVDGTPTWAAAENVAYNPGALPFRLRVSLDNTAGDGAPPAPWPYAIYVSRNGGPYQPVTGVSTNACVGTGGNSEPNGTPILIPRLTRPV